MPYIVYLMDPLSAMSPTLAIATITKLQQLFDAIAPRVPTAGGILVQSPPAAMMIYPKDNELVIYVLPEGITVVDLLPIEPFTPWRPRSSPLLTHHWA